MIRSRVMQDIEGLLGLLTAPNLGSSHLVSMRNACLQLGSASLHTLTRKTQGYEFARWCPEQEPNPQPQFEPPATDSPQPLSLESHLYG